VADGLRSLLAFWLGGAASPDFGGDIAGVAIVTAGVPTVSATGFGAALTGVVDASADLPSVAIYGTLRVVGTVSAGTAAPAVYGYSIPDISGSVSLRLPAPTVVATDGTWWSGKKRKKSKFVPYAKVLWREHKPTHE
jgi:hypothetical protein